MGTACRYGCSSKKIRERRRSKRLWRTIVSTCGGPNWSRPRRWAWPAWTEWRWGRWRWTATIRQLAGAGWWPIIRGWGRRMRWPWGRSSYESYAGNERCNVGGGAMGAVRRGLRVPCGGQIGHHAPDDPHHRHHSFCEPDDPI